MKQFLMSFSFSLLLHALLSLVMGSVEPSTWSDGWKMIYVFGILVVWILPIMSNYVEDKDNFKN